MGVVVHGVDAPFITGLVMLDMPDAVNSRVPHIDVWRAHINLKTENVFAIGKLTDSHSSKQIQVFIDRSDTKGTVFSRPG